MKVIRASSIGHPCCRKIWYDMMGIEEEFSLQTLFTFDIGTALEPVAVKYLKLDNWEVKYNEGSQEAEILTVIPVNDNVRIEGHHDLIMRYGETGDWYMVDVKTMNSYAYKTWRKEGTLRKYPQYADQLTIYAAGEYARQHNISKCAVVAINKDKVEFPLPIDAFDFDPERFEGLKAKAAYIASNDEPPQLDEDIPSWACTYCGHKVTRCEGI